MSNNIKYGSLLVLSAIFGGVIAIGNRTVWQDPVESAQVLAGLVTYPADNPFYAFHVKVWSLLNQVIALLLKSGVSEISASLLLEGTIAAVSFVALFLVVHAICGKPLIALLVPMLMYSLSLVGASVAYPIALLGSQSSYGLFGLSYMLLVIGVLGSGHYRSGGFLLGLAPAIHPALGAFCLMVVAISVLINMRELRPLLPRLIGSFALGMTVSLASLGWQLHYSPHLPKLDTALKKEYLDAFIRNFDYHRATGEWRSAGVFLGIMMAALSAIVSRMLDLPARTKLLFTTIYSSVAATLAMVLLSDHIPILFFLKVLIPWRFMNYANLCIIPVCLGILAVKSDKKPGLSSLLFLVTVAISFSWRLLNIPGDVILYLAIILLVLTVVALKLPDFTESYSSASSSWQSPVVLFLILLLVVRQVIPAIRALPASASSLRDRTNTEILAITSQRPGLLLTAGTMHLIQLTTRRPVLLDASALDCFPYVLDTGPRFNEILKQAYGLDLFTKPPGNAHFQGGLTLAHKGLWEARSIEEWKEIRDKFGVTDVLTPDSWELKLPLVAQGFNFKLYSIKDK